MVSAICVRSHQNARGRVRVPQQFIPKVKDTIAQKLRAHPPGGARMGHASLMQPARPLPTVRFVNLPLRLGPNSAAAIIAAKVARGHGTSTSGTLGSTTAAHRGLLRTRICAPSLLNR